MPPSPRSQAAVWKPLVICPRADVERRLEAALAELALEPPCTVAEYPRAGSAAALAGRQACNICFLDAASDAERAQSLISELAPLLPVVVLHPRNDADLILRSLRRGAREFLADPTPDALRGIFQRLGRTRGDTPHRTAGAVYCVAPGKPGSGASTLAAHLAIELRRTGAHPVLLVDTDRLAASIAFMLKLKPEFHLHDVERDWARMDEDLWRRLTVPAFGVDVLAAPEDPAAGADLRRPFAAELCAFWRERYRAIVLDLPDIRAAVDGGLAELADVLLLVTTNELAALQATVRGLRYLDAGAGDRSKLRLILNRYTPATGLRREDVETALSLEPFAILSNDYEVIQAALLEGKPAPPGSRFHASVQALCRRLGHGAGPEKPDPCWLSYLFHGRPANKSARIPV